MIPLHVHTNYSLLQGTIRIEELLETCRTNNFRSIALTDTNVMNGLIQFSKKCIEANIKPVLGTCITDPDDEKKYVIFLAKNNQGYSDICKIITQRKLNDDFNLHNILRNTWKDLFLLTPSIEMLSRTDKSNSLYAEIIPTSSNRLNASNTYKFARENDIHVVGSNPIYFLKKNDFELHKLVTAIRLNKVIDNLKETELVDDDFYFKSLDEIRKTFIKIPEALTNTDFIESQCNVDLKLNEYKYPSYPQLNSDSATFILSQAALKGLKSRYKTINDKVYRRLEYELQVINELNFSNYFLIVWDIVQEAKKRGMMTIGRGSAANSLVAYCLELTQVDPIKHNLYFERFLNKARTSPPDVDLDFSWKERDEIVKYIFDKYGYERVAMISTTVTFRARSAFRETAKAFGFTDSEISKYSKKIPWTNAANLTKISEMFPESKNLGFENEPWKTIVNFASRLANFPRHLSIHPSGIVITPTKITDYCALEYAKNKGLGLIITQPDMYSIEDLGLIKIDILSQRSLGVLRDTMEVIKKNYN